ncbi:hypothetical protein ACMDB5_13005 [Flavobacterium sp. W1B]|uniref:hypothetical protein n=1 Tax=Flavobacterium sp. W1B TaxID=3394146 RepID=UPI0039BC3FD7
MHNTATKFRPILFSTPMVQAILEGRKTQTRRIVKDNLLQTCTDEYNELEFLILTSKCPYEVGDVLWVRETFAPISNHKLLRYIYKGGADWTNDLIKWKPSIFMPKEACRIFLKIKSIRVERLQDISEDDAIAEGIYAKPGEVSKRVWYRKYVTESVAKTEGAFTESAIECFKTLWESINGKESLEKNPFVWVYEFEQIEKPLDFIV